MSKNLTSLKYLSEYELAIRETYGELVITKTLIKEEIVRFYIDNLYAKFLYINRPMFWKTNESSSRKNKR